MKTILSIFLIFCLTLPFAFKVYFIGDYCVNYIEYATKLCENKENTELQCNGKCQLNKNLNFTNSPEKELPNSTNAHHIELSSFIVPNIIFITKKLNTQNSKKTSYYYLNSYNFLKHKIATPPPEQFV